MKKVMIMVNVTLLVSSNIQTSQVEKNEIPEKETAVIAGLLLQEVHEHSAETMPMNQTDPGVPDQSVKTSSTVTKLLHRRSSTVFEDLEVLANQVIKEASSN